MKQQPKNPREFNPLIDEFPREPLNEELLEWKLDLIAVLLAQLAGGINILILVFIPGLGAIIALLAAILGVLTSLQALLAFILFFLVFIVARVVVPFLIRQSRTP